MWNITNIYDSFSETFSESRKNLKWPEIDYFVSLIKKKNLKQVRILDVGCGNGRLLNYLKDLKIDYVWVDSSSWMINEAKKLFPWYNFQVLDMLEIDKIWNFEFDFIFFLASFHHLQNENSRLKVLQKTKKVLAKDGIIAMTNWNLMWDKLSQKYKDSYNGNGNFEIKIGEFKRYYHWFELEELAELFSKSGLQIIENRVFEWENNIISVVG